MGVVDEMRVVLVSDDDKGRASFTELGTPNVPPAGAQVDMPDVLSGSWYWATSIRRIGAPMSASRIEHLIDRTARDACSGLRCVASRMVSRHT